jgi:hypothetical protein
MNVERSERRSYQMSQTAKNRWTSGEGPEPPGLLDADTCWEIGLDPTGRDGDPRHPFTEADLTELERHRLTLVRRFESERVEHAYSTFSLREAIALVTPDWTQGWDETDVKTPHVVAATICNNLHLGVGRDAWQDHGDALSAAYRVILEATDAAIEALKES